VVCSLESGNSSPLLAGKGRFIPAIQGTSPFFSDLLNPLDNILPFLSGRYQIVTARSLVPPYTDKGVELLFRCGLAPGSLHWGGFL
jgi:hypothetical protein